MTTENTNGLCDECSNWAKGLKKQSNGELICSSCLNKKETVKEGNGLKRAFAAAKKSRGEKLTAQEQKNLDANTFAARQQKGDKNVKKPVKETKAINGLALLVESELEKASVVIAAKGILDKLQKMAENLSSIEADDLFPIMDSMRLSFGPQIADKFNDVVTQKVRSTMDVIQDAKQAITSEVGRLEASVNGEPTSDLGMDMPSDEEMPDMGMDDDADLGMGDQPNDMDMGRQGDMASDLDASFDSPANDSTAAGRARKESVQMKNNIKALRESKNPDRLIFETFRRTLIESRDAVRSAQAVAKAFAIDYSDVVTVIKEGKAENTAIKKDTSFKVSSTKEAGVFCVTGNNSNFCYLEGSKTAANAKVKELTAMKSEKVEEGKSNREGKAKGEPSKTKGDWKVQRKEKQKVRDNFDKVDESEEVEEGKTWKDDEKRGNTFKKKGWEQERKAKAKNRQDTDESFEPEVDEGKTWKDDESRGHTDKKKGWTQDRKAKATRKREETDESENYSFKSVKMPNSDFDLKHIKNPLDVVPSKIAPHPEYSFKSVKRPNSDSEVDEGKTYKDDEKGGHTDKKKGWANQREEKQKRRTPTDEALTDPVKARLASNEKAAAARRAKGFSAMDAKKKVAESCKYEEDLKDDEPRVVSGVKGVKSTKFKKTFANQKAMERWMDSDVAGDYEVQCVERA